MFMASSQFLYPLPLCSFRAPILIKICGFLLRNPLLGRGLAVGSLVKVTKALAFLTVYKQGDLDVFQNVKNNLMFSYTHFLQVLGSYIPLLRLFFSDFFLSFFLQHVFFCIHLRIFSLHSGSSHY